MALEATLSFSYRSSGDIFERLLFLDSIKDDTRKYREELIEPAVAWKYQGDFYGLLNHMNIEPKYWLPSLYLSGYTSPVQYDGEKLTILVAKDVNFKTRR